MSRTYVIADLHGMYDLLQKCLERIEGNSEGGTVVFLGDYVDRGPGSREILERLMAGPKLPGWEWVCLKGNHEDMMEGVVLHGWPMKDWLDSGGDATIRSFDVGGWPPSDEVIRWVRTLPLCYQDDHRVYVHAALEPGNDQISRILLWGRMEGDWEHELGHVVHGHTMQRKRPLLLEHRTNLDGGSFVFGVQHVGVFEDELPGGPVEVWWVK